MASAASAPARKAAPPARHPRSVIVPGRGSGGGPRRRRWPHAQAPDASGIDVEHFEFDARRMAHDLAAFGNAAEQGEDQAAYRIDLTPLVFGQHAADLLLEELDGRAAVDVDRTVDPARDRRRLGNVVLVLDLAHDLLDQILDGQKPVGAAELV